MHASSNNANSLFGRSSGFIVFVFGLLICVGHFSSQAKQLDGFIMHCISTGNGTGSCTNEEDGKGFQCLIVPGQIITCPVNASQSVECEWISGVHASQAQFWCDPQDETVMYSSVDSDSELDVFDDSENLENEIDSSSPPSSESVLDNKIFKGAF